MGLIDDIFKELKSIYNNKTSLKLLFDTNILGKGYGTNLRKNGDKILIDSYSGYFSIDKREPMDYDRQKQQIKKMNKNKNKELLKILIQYKKKVHLDIWLRNTLLMNLENLQIN